MAKVGKIFSINTPVSDCVKGFECVEKFNNDSIVAVGNFDGLHLGHQKLLEFALRESRALGIPLVVLSFLPHPARYLKKPYCSVLPLRQKLSLLTNTGAVVCLLRFNKKLRKTEAQDFIKHILKNALNSRVLVVGENWRFGKDALGEPSLVSLHGIKVLEVELFRVNNVQVSSSLLRSALSHGDLESVKSLLGRPYEVCGTVIKGQGLGSKIGFPTANISGTHNLCLKEGVYIVVSKEGLLGLANFGKRPTVGGLSKRLEVYFPNFKGSLEGKVLNLRFEKFLRPQMKFSSLEELRRQISKDLLSLKEFAPEGRVL
ncbi:MAG: riboflavin biosynthesis protein RibF [Aquificaceae bacterium]|nr:riboflavin biosynthesis protein RibF [Aquificaceae bacterium]MDW8237801.1 riboflavin biosynthesis protein RibF [Aquificaceae bacterium]